MPILRAITRTQRNATPLRCLETGFPGPGRIGLFFFFFFEETFTFSLEEATSISSTKNYLYVTVVTPVLCSYTLSARVLRPAKKQLTIKCTDLVLLVH